MGELLTRWTVRWAVACYLATIALQLAQPQSAAKRRAARVIWTAGLVLFLIHVVCAFQFHHHWSHAEAYAHTARVTAKVVGWNWGGGLYFNYLFAAVWAADVVRWWRYGNSVRRTRLAASMAQGFLAFMVLNATVVFGPPFWRYIGMATLIVFGSDYWKSRLGTGTNDAARDDLGASQDSQ